MDKPKKFCIKNGKNTKKKGAPKPESHIGEKIENK